MTTRKDRRVRRPRMSRTVLGTISALVFVAVCAVAFTGQPMRWLGDRSKETVSAEFATTARLTTGTPVRIRGVDVGTVKRMEVAPDGASARVDLLIDHDQTPLFRDASAAIRWRTVLGGNYYVDLDPGTSASGELGPAGIDLRHTESQVELDQVASALTTDARGGLRTLLKELPRALADEDAPAAALKPLAAGAATVRRGVRALRGRDLDVDLQNLIRNAGRATTTLDTPDEQLRRLVESAAGTAAVTARREAELRGSLAAAASALPQTQTTMAQLHDTLDRLQPAVDGLTSAAPDVAPTLRRLQPTLRLADGVLRDARPLVRSLRPSAAALRSAASQATPLVDELAPILDRAGKRILPDLALVDEHSKRPTFQMIGPTVAGLNALAAQFDGISHTANLVLQIGQSNLDTLPCKTLLADPTAEQLITCEGLKQLLSPTPRTALRAKDAKK